MKCASWPDCLRTSGEPTGSLVLLLQVMAEKEAWQIAEQHGLDLVTIHPVFVIGPVLSTRTDATSVQMIVVRNCFWALAVLSI